MTGYELVENWRKVAPQEYSAFSIAHQLCADELEAFLEGLAELSAKYEHETPMELPCIKEYNHHHADRCRRCKLDALLGTPKEVAR